MCGNTHAMAQFAGNVILLTILSALIAILKQFPNITSLIQQIKHVQDSAILDIL
jgi:hypothetical protein